MYYIQVNRGSIYIRKCSEDFDLVSYIEEDNYYPIEILKNQFEDKSLLQINTIVEDISDDDCFDIVGDSVDDKKYTLLTAHQVREVLKELL